MYLYGASGHAKVVADILCENDIPIEGVYDDNLSLMFFKNYNFLGILKETKPHQEFLICIGNNASRKKVVNNLQVTWGSAISKQTNISKTAVIKEGIVIMRGASINTDAVIGKHVILSTNCSIDHDCIVEDYVHVSPNVALAGNVHVGEGASIGTGACVIPGIKIGKWATIGAGTVIIRDVPDYAVVVGNPGRIIKYNEKTI